MGLNSGKVMWFNDRKGYGFIRMEDGREVFAHYSQIVSEAKYKTLNPDDEVTFDLYEKPYGLEAYAIKRKTY